MADGTIVPLEEPPVPSVPMDFSWAQKLGLIRKPTSFMSSVSDDRGEELTYAGMPISAIFKENLGVGGVVSLLWFQVRLSTCLIASSLLLALFYLLFANLLFTYLLICYCLFAIFYLIASFARLCRAFF